MATALQAPLGGWGKHRKIAHTCPQCKNVRFVEQRRTRDPHFTGLCFVCSRGIGLPPGTHGEAAHGAYGERRTKAYRAWASMKSRCLNPAHPAYPRYGGRGVTVCDRWLNSFENFRDDMGHPPNGMTLERIDNNRGYEPGNCKWADWDEQQSNRRDNVWLTFEGRTQTASQWAREVGIKATTISHRILRGWSAERALTTPPRKVRA